MSRPRLILGSRSPRRLELLSQIVAPDRIAVQPPDNADEASFEGLATLDEILQRLTSIATQKEEQVRRQVADDSVAILCADTTIIGKDASTGSLHVLGQPPEQDWQAIVRDWFHQFYFGHTHFAATAVVISSPNGNCTFHVLSKVKMCPRNDELLEWYLATSESMGKAGGYALQGAGSIFIDAVQGSLSNVVGLPLRETRQALLSLNLL